MIANSSISGISRKSLFLRAISKPQPTREDVSSAIELTSSKLIESGESLLYSISRNSEAIYSIVKEMETVA